MRDRRISAYLTTFDSAAYALADTVASALEVCSEVVVADAGSVDGTWELLLALARGERRLRLLRVPVDRNRPDWAVAADLELSAQARLACRGAYCLELEPGEVLAASDARLFTSILPELDGEVTLVALSVLDYWDGVDLVRRDLLPAAPRLSRNLPAITHGIPASHRMTDAAGRPYARPCTTLSGSYIDAGSGTAVPCRSLYPLDLEDLRHAASARDWAEAMHAATAHLPVVHRFVWTDVERELRRTRDHWAAFHASLYRSRPKALPFFDKPWGLVTDVELAGLARRLRQEGPGALSGAPMLGAVPARRPLPERAPAAKERRVPRASTSVAT